MARQTKADKAIDTAVEAAYYRHFDCVQVNIMDLGKIMKLGKNAIVNGDDLDVVMGKAVDTFGQSEKRNGI